MIYTSCGAPSLISWFINHSEYVNVSTINYSEKETINYMFTMENGAFIDDFPMTTSIHRGFSIAMFDDQRVIKH